MASMMLFVFLTGFITNMLVASELYTTYAPPSDPSTPFFRGNVTSSTEDRSLPNPRGITACAHFRLHYYRVPLTVFMQIFDRNTSTHITVGVTPRGQVLVRDENFTFRTQVPELNVGVLNWTHVCLVVASNFSHVVVGGVVAQEKNITRNLLDNFIINIGAESARRGENIETNGRFVGDISIPEVWHEVLTHQDIKILMSCRSLNIQPKRVHWDHHGEISKSLSQDRSFPCTSTNSEIIVVEVAFTFSEAYSFCASLDIDMVDILNERNLESVRTCLADYSGQCFENGRGSWIVQRTDQTSASAGACYAITAALERSVFPCASQHCALCSLRKTRTVFYMRWAYLGDETELAFIAAASDNNYFYFQGVEGHVIEHKKDKWILKSSFRGTTLAELQNKKIIGSRMWTVKENWDEKGKEVELLISFNSCSNTQTWCASGSCILPEKICDQVRDCDDGSDEISCTTHQITAAQKSSQPTEKINSINSKPAEVDFDVEVLRLIKKSDEPLQAVIKLSMTWTNTETEFPSIKHGHSSRLPDSFAAWKPSIIPEGLPPKADSCIGQECDNPSLLTVVTSQTASFSGVDLSGDKLLRNVTLRLTRLSVHSLDCGGEYMTFFPFEQHVCEINFKTKYENYSLKSLSAAPPPGFIPHFIVLKVLIKGWGSQQDSIGFSQAVLKIHVKRLTGFYVVVVFIPSFLLLMLNSILLWVKDPHEYRLLSSTFTVISFLIMWMIIVSNSPNSSSIRAIDVWMCFCLTHSILHVIVNTIIRALLVGDDETRSRRLSTLSSRPLSRLRQVKPLELNSLYDVLLAKMAMEENENKWTHAYWVMFCARIVSPVLTLLFMISFWPFVVYFSQENL